MSEQEQRGQLDQLRQWTVARHQQLSNTFLARVRQGHIKLCHGDLHLGNIYYGDGRCILFDCIEFNPELSQIDTASDLAFAHMDLALKTSMGHADLMLNEYLAITGDYELLKVLDYYCAYRSMVRAKVHSLAARQATQTSQQTQAKILSQVSLAAKYTQPKPQAIVLMCGLSGSGKTHVADQIKAATGFIHLRSDVERKRLFGLALNADSHENGLQIYTHAATQQTYEVLAKQVQTVVEAGYGVIVDATFIHAAWRQTFLNAARQLGISACIVHCLVTPAEARRRLAARHEDASEADYSIYKQQSARFEAVAEGEAEQLISIDTQTADYLPPLLASISDVCRLTTWH